jgi:hypothetical protein
MSILKLTAGAAFEEVLIGRAPGTCAAVVMGVCIEP